MATTTFKTTVLLLICLVLLPLDQPAQRQRQQRKFPTTPLPEKVLDILTNEISGQIIFNNEVRLAGAPWIRDTKEFSGVLYEADEMIKLVKGYGIDTVKLVTNKRDRTFSYPMAAEFWQLTPRKRRIACLDADPAMVVSNSQSVDVKGTLIYLPPLSGEKQKKGFTKKEKQNLRDKIVLMWRVPRSKTAKMLDGAGVKGVISFRAQDRYFDPDQVIYSWGAFRGYKNFRFGFVVSWRQWSELLEDVEKGQVIEAHCKTKIETFDDKFDSVLAWIPGTEPDAKAIMFTGHLFEGYTKRGANDNMSGCVVQLEILRALSKLIKEGTLPQPRRSIYFFWPNEISGTFDFFKTHPELMAKIGANINMDMVGEALRKNNSLFTQEESPTYLPTYLDGLGQSIMNYLWRTNDIVFLPDTVWNPRGQIFPKPIWEKNGSRDAFRFAMRVTTGGSDHICFHSPTVGIPAIMLIAWPDQWYHADTDTPDKSDPTQLKRVGFIGAAMALVGCHCTDEVLPGLVDAVSNFGFERIGTRDLPKTLAILNKASKEKLADTYGSCVDRINLAADREIGALRSIETIYSGSDTAKSLLKERISQWQAYKEGLMDLLRATAGSIATRHQATLNLHPAETEAEQKTRGQVPMITEKVRFKEFRLERTQEYKEFMKANKTYFKGVKLNYRSKRAILNYINGQRSIYKIWRYAMVESGQTFTLADTLKYLELLKAVGWIEYLSVN